MSLACQITLFALEGSNSLYVSKNSNILPYIATDYKYLNDRTNTDNILSIWNVYMNEHMYLLIFVKFYMENLYTLICVEVDIWLYTLYNIQWTNKLLFSVQTRCYVYGKLWILTFTYIVPMFCFNITVSRYLL